MFFRANITRNIQPLAATGIFDWGSMARSVKSSLQRGHRNSIMTGTPFAKSLPQRGHRTSGNSFFSILTNHTCAQSISHL